MLVAAPGAAYRANQIVRQSHYNDAIDTENGRLAGNSRIWGDAPAATQIQAIDALAAAAQAHDLTVRETAHVLAIARVESGFNPDAAAGTTSASGLGQFVDRTGLAYGLTDSNRWDVDAQADALVRHFIDNRRLAESRGEGEEYIYRYHHDGPTLDFGGLAIARNRVIPLVNQYERLINENRRN